jgi:tRNA pseudouridine55 synthase
MLLVDKPAGMTSHDVVAVARRALGERRIGHAGTLDPFATGLLVLMVGRATRLLPYVSGEPKVYEATIRFGSRTDTDDVTGAVVEEAALPSPDRVDAAVVALTGPIDQMPPAYSAKQVAGVRSYAAARKGESVALQPARVTVHRWDVGARRGNELDVTITCGGGTYIRALARDLGALAGSAAHLAALRRVRSGQFSVDDAVSIEALREGGARLAPAREAVPDLATRVLDDAEVRRVVHGQQLPAHAAEAPRLALVDGAGELVAIAERDGESLRPRVVLRAS